MKNNHIQAYENANGDDEASDGIAIVGMAGRFPYAQDLEEFWKNIRNGIDCVQSFSEAEMELSSSDSRVMKGNPNYVRKGAIVEGADCFDAQFFGMQPKEVEFMDPQHRIFLECSWHAIEDAGYDANRYEGRIGVFASCYMNTYLLANLDTNPEFIASLSNAFHGGSLQMELGNDKDYLATRVAYKLNLRGPAITMQTACSSSLVAITQACQNLVTYQCDMALAGGVTLRFPQKRGYLYTNDGMVSPEGKCRTFDANARGTIFGNGAGVVLLKRIEDALADGDDIYAVIKGWGLNNDGGSKYSYTAPSVDGQAEVIALAQSLANVSAESVTYIEAHGTGTSLGDPIEIEALTKAFRLTTSKNQYCAIGSLKTNIGHLDCAAGVAGLIKTALALHHKEIPPSLHFDTPNPKIDFLNTPFFVNTELRKWPLSTTPRRAGLSSFGVGGTNAHVVLEEASRPTQQYCGNSAYHVLPLSAKSSTALTQMANNLAQHLRQHPSLDIANVANTLQRGRSEFNHRSIVISKSIEEASNLLTQEVGKSGFSGRVLGSNLPIVFMFPGQGAQHTNMGRRLYEVESVFREHIDHCTELLLPHLQFDIRERLYPNQELSGKGYFRGEASIEQNEDECINETLVAQPGIFITSYALAKLWMHWGIQPEAMIGHSIGEFVAACLGGVFSLEDALAIVVERAKGMQQLPHGTMLSIRLGERDVRKFLEENNLEGYLDVAVINSPKLCVVSGPTESIQTLHARLEIEGIVARILHTSHAFHSHMMEPAVRPFANYLQNVSLKPTTIPIMSTVTGEWLNETQATDPDYWAGHLRETVNFSGGIQELLKEGNSVFLEVGPGQTLSTLTKQHIEKSADQTVLSSFPHAKQTIAADEFLLTILGRLWIGGTRVNWEALYGAHKPLRVRLPIYPFTRKRYWVERKIKETSKPFDASMPPIAKDSTAIQSEKGAINTNGSSNGCSHEPDNQITQVLQRQIQVMKQQLETLRNT